MNDTISFTLERTAAVLIRSFWLGMGFVTLWFFTFLAGGQWGYKFHQALWSGLTRHEFDLIHLCGMANVKLLVFVGFLFPYLAIRMFLQSQ